MAIPGGQGLVGSLNLQGSEQNLAYRSFQQYLLADYWLWGQCIFHHTMQYAPQCFALAWEIYALACILQGYKEAIEGQFTDQVTVNPLG